MTKQTVPAILDAVLDPLVSITSRVGAALLLARRNELPRAFIETIEASATALDGLIDTLTDITVALDPNLAKDQL